MSRTLSTTISSAVDLDATRPIYLLEIGFSTTVRAATWDAAITWDGETWSASGIQVKGLNANGTSLVMPTGESDPWLALVLNEGARDKPISIYEHHTDATASPQSDAVLIFTGIMDEATITDKLTVKVLDTSRAKAFPAESADQPKFTHLMTSGDVITWGNNTITVN